MNKTIAGVAVAVIAVIIIGGLVLVVNKDDGNPATTSEHSSMDTSGQKQSNLDTSKDSAQKSSGQAVQTNTVDIKDYAFSPAKIQVKKGTSVTWTNQDTVRHDVTPDQESDNFKASKLLDKGESYSYTFDTIGTYSYNCSPHPYMKGTVEVIE